MYIPNFEKKIKLQFLKNYGDAKILISFRILHAKIYQEHPRSLKKQKNSSNLLSSVTEMILSFVEPLL
jgi:hypothetical protein